MSNTLDTATGASKVMSTEIEKWRQSNPIEELAYSQKEIARFLELGYLGLRDFPELAAEIRKTANEARTQHVLTAGLFKKFVVTATSIVNTYCPIMKDAVKLRDSDIVKESLGEVLEMCLDMKKETESARNSYLLIQKKVQDGLGDVVTKKKIVADERKIIEHEKEINQMYMDEAKQQEEDLNRQKDELNNKVKKLMQDRDDWLEKSVKSPEGHTGTKVEIEESYTALDHSMVPATTIIGGAFGLVGGVAGAAVGAAVGCAVGKVLDTIADPFNTSSKRTTKRVVTTHDNEEDRKARAEASQQAKEASKEAQQYLDKTYEEKRKVEEVLWQRKKETMEKLAHIKALDLQKENIGDISSLKEAVSQLGNVDKQFVQIVLFWDSMATMLKKLYQDQKASGVYLKKIEDERYSTKFLLSVFRTESVWNQIGIKCDAYASGTDRVISAVYGFLSKPVDNYSDDEVRKRKGELEKEITDELEQLTI